MSVLFYSSRSRVPVESRQGALLSKLAAEAGFPLNLQCGGQGACQGCLLNLGPGRYRINEKETVIADGQTLEARAFKTTVLSDDAAIEIPARSLLKIGSCASADFYATRLQLFQVWKEFQRIAEQPDTCHLAETNEFENRFIDALALPNLDPDEFPKIMEQL